MKISSVVIKLDNGDNLEFKVGQQIKNKQTFFTQYHCGGENIKQVRDFNDGLDEYKINKKPSLILQSIDDFKQVVVVLDKKQLQLYRDKIHVKYTNEELIDIVDFIRIVTMSSDAEFDKSFHITEYSLGSDNPNIVMWINRDKDISLWLA